MQTTVQPLSWFDIDGNVPAEACQTLSAASNAILAADHAEVGRFIRDLREIRGKGFTGLITRPKPAEA